MKKTLKRYLAIVMVVLMVAALLPASAMAGDYDSHWAAGSIKQAVDMGWYLRTTDDNYRPDDSITRAEFVTAVNRLMAFTGTASLSDFSDVKAGDWYYNEFARAVANGLFADADDTLRPKDLITRDEAISILSDIAESSEDADEDLAAALDESFPEAVNLTRAETAVLLVTMYDGGVYGVSQMTKYQILVLEIAFTKTFPADFAFDFQYMFGEMIYSPFAMTLIRGEGHNILVDSGVDVSVPKKAQMFDDAFAENAHTPEAILNTVGLTCEEIDVVILSHLHWDHATASLCYPNATVYVQREELDLWTEVSSNPIFGALTSGTFDTSTLGDLKQLDKEGRLEFLDGDYPDLLPGISIIAGGMDHSFKSQCVVVDTQFNGAAATFVVTGDVGNRPENFAGAPGNPGFIPNIHFGVGSPMNTLKLFQRIMDIVDGNVDRIIPTHDGSRIDRYPTVISELGLHISTLCP